MALEREIFDLTGPKQLTDVDWKNKHHCRAVAASLVQGAYNLEHDRQKSQDSRIQPSRWWYFFHFQVKRVLIDDKDGSIYGVVYEIKHTYRNLLKCAPKQVIAFRGTILKPSTGRQDMTLNIKVLTDQLHKDEHRFKPALEAVQRVVQEDGSANIWLAGHSLGSAIAMMVGKFMALEGNYIETFLFNPPFLGSSLLKIINNQYLEDKIRFTKTLINVGILLVGGDRLRKEQYDQFNKLSFWIPNLFVNQDDPICKEYIGHSRNRNKILQEIGAGMKRSVAALHSPSSILKARLTEDQQLPIQLLPKAYLTISQHSSSCNIFQAHGLKQWWYQMSIGPGFANSSTKVSIGEPFLVGGP